MLQFLITFIIIYSLLTLPRSILKAKNSIKKYQEAKAKFNQAEKNLAQHQIIDVEAVEKK